MDHQVFAPVRAESSAVATTWPQRYRTGWTLRGRRGCGRPGRSGAVKGQILEHLDAEGGEPRIQGLFHRGQGRGRMLNTPVFHAGNEVQAPGSPLVAGGFTIHSGSSVVVVGSML